ncbi:hypothetical protein V7S43_009171 [Phytophthora oleae]|uniref:Ankyrin repeat-containing domain n=1 Tax=Phytophthora oleae TaxID=2107226 RepID=A0ABD3FG35_9STRA
MNGHLEVAKYLHAQDFTGRNHKTLEWAARRGDLVAVQWLWAQLNADPKADSLCVHGEDQFVSWASPLTKAMAAAASNGHLEIVQYLHTIALTLAGKKRKRDESSCYPCKLEMDNVVTEAARSGHLGAVQWVCTHTTVNSTKEAMASAAGSGHFPAVKWLHENLPHEDFRTAVTDAAAGCGDLSLLKWLHTNRPNERWSTIAIYSAARGGHLHVLRWLFGHESLYNHDCLVPSNALKLALIGNQFDALIFVYHEYKNWSYDIIVLEDDDIYVFDEHMREWIIDIDNLRESSESD